MNAALLEQSLWENWPRLREDNGGECRGLIAQFLQFWKPVVSETMVAIALWTYGQPLRTVPRVQVHIPTAMRMAREVLSEFHILMASGSYPREHVRNAMATAHLAVVARWADHVEAGERVCLPCLASYFEFLTGLNFKEGSEDAYGEKDALNWFEDDVWDYAVQNALGPYRSVFAMSPAEEACPYGGECEEFLLRRARRYFHYDSENEEYKDVFPITDAIDKGIALKDLSIKELFSRILPHLVMIASGLALAPDPRNWSLHPVPIIEAVPSPKPGAPEGGGRTASLLSVVDLSTPPGVPVPKPRSSPGAVAPVKAPEPGLDPQGKPTVPTTDEGILGGGTSVPGKNSDPFEDDDFLGGGSGRREGNEGANGESSFLGGGRSSAGDGTGNSKDGGGDGDLLGGGKGQGQGSGTGNGDGPGSKDPDNVLPIGPGPKSSSSQPSTLQFKTLSLQHNLVGPVFTRMGSKTSCQVSLNDGTYVIQKSSNSVSGPFEDDPMERQARVGRVLQRALGSQACEGSQ